ncbi:hypothetical protein BCR33DRAFT_426934 [Rhizoclosmatium globosum]|uniref:Uncharacterized protein n=1 Tax=Rhizoclosmatium globosum TaxID=329046 RepID=A0A1Y2BV59_9FUNG|nr:hypothetical protein BCR33DRAFT_426934 [Rhizoclosmatium globosum]|eukprot:ORY38636.1 hypothetical protein BCR33DRAFT_426934 [Rhizoclosmatium globosum]
MALSRQETLLPHQFIRNCPSHSANAQQLPLCMVHFVITDMRRTLFVSGVYLYMTDPVPSARFISAMIALFTGHYIYSYEYVCYNYRLLVLDLLLSHIVCGILRAIDPLHPRG